DVAYIKGAQLILMGWHKPVRSKHILGSVVQDVVNRAQTNLAIYVQRHFEDHNRVIVPFQNSEQDMPALQTALQIASYYAIPLHIPQLDGNDAQTLNQDLTTLLSTPPFDNLQTQIHLITDTDSIARQQDILAFTLSDLIVVGLEKLPATIRPSYRLRHEEFISHPPASPLIWRRQ